MKLSSMESFSNFTKSFLSMIDLYEWRCIVSFFTHRWKFFQLNRSTSWLFRVCKTSSWFLDRTKNIFFRTNKLNILNPSTSKIKGHGEKIVKSSLLKIKQIKLYCNQRYEMYYCSKKFCMISYFCLLDFRWLLL